jgi:hypothetical protein
MAMGRSHSARGGKREATSAGATERLLTVDAGVAEAKRPAARAARLDNEIKARAAGVRIFGARCLWPDRLDEPMGDDFSHHCILPRGVKG